MEKIDPALARRVWERVQGKQQSLGGLCGQAGELAQLYSAMARRAPAGVSKRLSRLQAEARSAERSLRGLCLMRGEQPGQGRLPEGKWNPRRGLERCMTLERQIMDCCGQWASDDNSGPVFQDLARRAEIRCALLPELLSLWLG